MQPTEPVLPAPIVTELLAAIRLASPALPIGAFAYSQGLEQAVEAGWVTDRRTATAWISAVLVHGVGRFDVPLLVRLFDAWSQGQTRKARRLDAWVLAGRESAELQAQEIHLGTALGRLLVDLSGASDATPPVRYPRSYVGAFALAAVHSGLSQTAALGSYCFAWLEHQTSAATRLVPLGQTDAQRALHASLKLVDGVIERGRSLEDSDVGATMPGLAIASALHETQYTRLFRS
jgi:urease accessory protein